MIITTTQAGNSSSTSHVYGWLPSLSVCTTCYYVWFASLLTLLGLCLLCTFSCVLICMIFGLLTVSFFVCFFFSQCLFNQLCSSALDLYFAPLSFFLPFFFLFCSAFILLLIESCKHFIYPFQLFFFVKYGLVQIFSVLDTSNVQLTH